MTEPQFTVPNDTADMLLSRLASATDVKASVVGIVLAILESEQSLRTHLDAGLPRLVRGGPMHVHGRGAQNAFESSWSRLADRASGRRPAYAFMPHAFTPLPPLLAAHQVTASDFGEPEPTAETQKPLLTT